MLLTTRKSEYDKYEILIMLYFDNYIKETH